MMVDAVDYTNSLARIRSRYADAQKELRANKDTEVENLEKSHEYQRDRARDAHLGSQRKMERDLAYSVERANKDTVERIDRKKKEFHENLVKAEKDFGGSLTRIKENYRKDLGKARRSFDENVMMKDEHHDVIQRDLKDKYDRNIETHINQQNKELGDIQQRNEKQAKRMREDFESDRKRILQDKKEKIDEIRQRSTDKALTNKRDKFRQLEIVKNDFDTQKKAMLRNQEDKLHNLRVKTDSKIQNMRDSFSEITKKTQKDHAIDKQKMIEEFGKEQREIDRRNQTEINDLRKRLLFSSKRPGKDGVLLSPEKIKEEQNKAKEDHYMEVLEKTNEDFAKKLTKNREDFTDKISDIKAKNSLRGAQESLNHSKDMALVKKKNREEKDKLVESFRIKDESSREAFNHRLGELKKANDKSKLDQIKASDDRIKKFVENNRKAVGKVKEHYQKKQRDLVLESKRNKFKDNEELKASFIRKLGEKDEFYQEKIDHEKIKREKVRDKFEDKIRVLEKKNVKDAQYNNFLVKQKHEQDQISVREKLAQKDTKYDEDMKQVRRDFRNKLLEIERRNTKKTKLMVQTLKDQLDTERTEMFNKMRMSEILSRRERSRIKKAFEQKIQALEEQHEDRVKNIELKYEEKIESMKEAMDKRD